MQLITIDSQTVPSLGFGTWALRGQECVTGVVSALSIGYRHIDTAQMYENEREVGQAIGQSGVARDEIFLTTKLKLPNFVRCKVITSTEESLQKLGMDYVDLMLLHWPNQDVPLAETLSALNELREEGKVRHIGVSNFPPSMVEEAARHSRVFCNQVEYHPYLSQERLRKQATSMDYLLTAYCPLAQGRVRKDAGLKDIGGTYGKAGTQVALRWLIQQANVSAIPKAAGLEHQAANFDIFDFELSDDHMEQIHAMSGEKRLVNPGLAPDWER